MALTARQAACLRLHRQLDRALARSPHRRFISGYPTRHPFVDSFVNRPCLARRRDRIGNYTFAEERPALLEAIRQFHRTADGIDYRHDEILVSAGSSPLIVTVLLFLRRTGWPSALYFRPIYHTFFLLASELDLPMIAVREDPLWDPDDAASLPKGRSALVVADPIWMAGRSLAAETMSALGRWQERTGSIVIVDGTFQYMKWRPLAGCEPSAGLLREQTIRLVCPTKALAVHGIRFAYLLGPARLLADLRWIAESVTGSASLLDLQVAMQLLTTLSSPPGNQPLMHWVSARYRSLIDTGVIADVIREPDCGYYVFARLTRRRPDDLLMGPGHFELDGHRGFVRVNLLGPWNEGVRVRPSPSRHSGAC